MSTPSAPPGPDNVLRNPTLTLSAAWAGRAATAPSSSADISLLMTASPWLLLPNEVGEVSAKRTEGSCVFAHEPMTPPPP